MTDVTKRLLLSLSPVVLLLAAAGCGGSGSSSPAAKSPVEQSGAPANTDATRSPERAASSPDAKQADDSSPQQRTNQQQPVASLPAWDQESSSSTQSRFGIIEDRKQAGARFTVEESAGKSAADRFFAAVPQPGFDSSRFTVAATPAGKSSPPARDAATSSLAPGSFKLPDGFDALPDEGATPEGMPLRIRCRKDAAIMALVPEGTFFMGVKGQEENAGPQLSVFLDAYYIDVNEITVNQYEQYRYAQKQANKRFSEPARAGNKANEPVAGVSWTEAHAYALWAEKDLPTEAQWEKAARGSQGFQFPWGNGPSVWPRERTADQIDPVASFRGDCSPFGVYDLAGNVREWCADYYGEKYYSQLAIEGGSTPRNPTGPKSSGGSNQRVVRGGDPNWHVWARTGIGQTERPTDVGFRCVLRLKGSKAGKADSGAKGAKS